MMKKEDEKKRRTRTRTRRKDKGKTHRWANCVEKRRGNKDGKK
jgi:hypothetical protein